MVLLIPRAEPDKAMPATSPQPTLIFIVDELAPLGPLSVFSNDCAAVSKPLTKPLGALETELSQLTLRVIAPCV